MRRCMGCMAEIPDNEIICSQCGYKKGTKVQEAYYLQPGQRIDGRYLLGRVLNYGGFGIIYIGWDQKLERRVAVKEYLPSDFSTRSYGSVKPIVYSGEAAQQFQAGLKSFISEARSLAEFNRIPETVDIYDCIMENDTGYIVMELLDGETVKDILARSKKISIEQAVEICMHVLQGLTEIHKAGIIHRDIAPDNIYITKENEIKILDFGAARYATESQSKSLSVILKRGYAPEEQYRSRGKQGAWTDVYAVGATFYNMITGVRPPESLERIANDTLKRPSELGVELSRSLENVIMNSLSVKQELRYRDAESFLEALKDAQSDKDADFIGTDQVSPINRRIPMWMKRTAGIAACMCLIFYFSGKISFNWDVFVESAETAVLNADERYVPDISGMSYEEAEAVLEERNLKLAIKGMNYSERIEKNRILSQIPEDGEITQKNKTVCVVMSGGTQEVMVPDLSGSTREDAAARIKAQKLVLDEKEIQEEYNNEVEKGRIITQTVDANTRVDVGTKISFSISLGNISEETAVLAVPNLTGWTKKQAEARLQKLKDREGFTYTIGSISKKHSTKVKKGCIISQSLKAGSKVRTNQVMELVISKGPEMVEVPNLMHADGKSASAKLKKLGFKVTKAKDYSSSVDSGHVISQSKKGGQKAAKGSTITLTISLGAQPAVDNNYDDTPAGNYDNTPAAPNLPVNDNSGNDNNGSNNNNNGSNNNNNGSNYNNFMPVSKDDDIPVLPD